MKVSAELYGTVWVEVTDHGHGVETLERMRVKTQTLEELLVSLDDAPDGLEEIYRLLARRLSGMIRVAGIPESDVADVLQLVFLDVWHFAKRFDLKRGTAEAWIFKIARNKIVDHKRRMIRRQKLQQRTETFLYESARVERDFSNDSVMDDLWTEVSIEEKQVLVLAYYYGFTQKEIAIIQKAPVGTVKSRASRGLEKMRRAWMAKENPQS